MTFKFTERKMDVSENLREYAMKKFKKLDRYFHQDATASITFNVERGRHTVEATVQQGNMLFRAVETTGDMYASVDGVVDAIDKQLIRNKTRLEKQLRKGAFEREIPGFVLEEDTYEVVRRKRFEVRPMTVDEAILQMNLLGHQFFFFKNSEEDDNPSVVYKRHDQGYGLIDCE